MAEMDTIVKRQYILRLTEEEYKFICDALQNGPVGETQKDAHMRKKLWDALHPPMAEPEKLR